MPEPSSQPTAMASSEVKPSAQAKQPERPTAERWFVAKSEDPAPRGFQTPGG